MKAVISLVKYIPIVQNIWILFVLFGLISDRLYPFFGQSILLNLLLYGLSVSLKFCYWHRILIISQSIIVFLEFLQNSGVIINDISIISISIILIGIINSTLIYYRYGLFIKNKNHNSTKKVN